MLSATLGMVNCVGRTERRGNAMQGLRTPGWPLSGLLRGLRIGRRDRLLVNVSSQSSERALSTALTIALEARFHTARVDLGIIEARSCVDHANHLARAAGRAAYTEGRLSAPPAFFVGMPTLQSEYLGGYFDALVRTAAREGVLEGSLAGRRTATGVLVCKAHLLPG
jgi:hypothetical protein